MEAVYEYENEKKMKLVDKCLQSESLKRKLQGLNELKDVVKSLTYSSERNKGIVRHCPLRKPGSRRNASSRRSTSRTATCS
jgi:hypothetical protein